MTELHFMTLDAGGTGCRVMISGQDGRQLATATGGGANLASDFEAACANITATIGNAYDAAGLPASTRSGGIAVLGVAGAEIGDAAARLEDRLGDRLDFAKLRVVSDRDTAIAGVLGSQDGTLAQIGTGSFFVTRRAGVIRHAGGWGLVLGDECSGAWLGRELLRATLRAHDGLEDSSRLTQTIMSTFGGDTDAIVLFAQTASPADFAAYAPQLFSARETGDSIAHAILQAAAHHLERTLAVMEAGSRHPLYLCGGVGKRYTGIIGDAYRDRLARPKGDSLSGALSLAMALHRDQ